MNRYWVRWNHPEVEWRSFSERKQGKNSPIENVLGYWKLYEWRTKDCYPVVAAMIDALCIKDLLDVLKMEWGIYDERMVRCIAHDEPNFQPEAFYPLEEWMKPRLATPANLKS
jgi:hypothetical protein